MHSDGQAQDDWAAQLYDGCAAELVLYGRALGLSHAEAEDVLHDSFRALLELRTPPREPRFYLIRTFRNRALNHHRTIWRRLRRELESSRWFERDTADPGLADAATSALSRLPVEQREVIVLRLWHRLTYEAAGEILGISPSTAAGRYRYGLQRLRTLLRQSNDETVRESGDPAAWLPSPSALPEG